MRVLRIAYNNSLRRLLGIPKHNSASGMFVQLIIKSFGELLRSYIHSFMNRIQCSNNLTLSSICESTVHGKMGTGKKGTGKKSTEKRAQEKWAQKKGHK